MSFLGVSLRFGFGLRFVVFSLFGLFICLCGVCLVGLSFRVWLLCLCLTVLRGFAVRLLILLRCCLLFAWWVLCFGFVVVEVLLSLLVWLLHLVVSLILGLLYLLCVGFRIGYECVFTFN